MYACKYLFFIPYVRRFVILICYASNGTQYSNPRIKVDIFKMKAFSKYIYIYILNFSLLNNKLHLWASSMVK